MIQQLATGAVRGHVAVTWRNGERDYTTDVSDCTNVLELDSVRTVEVQFDYGTKDTLFGALIGGRKLAVQGQESSGRVDELVYWLKRQGRTRAPSWWVPGTLVILYLYILVAANFDVEERVPSLRALSGWVSIAS